MYFISKNNLMYSKRRLLTAFSNYKNSDISKKEVITEKVSNHKLIIFISSKFTAYCLLLLLSNHTPSSLFIVLLPYMLWLLDTCQMIYL